MGQSSPTQSKIFPYLQNLTPEQAEKSLEMDFEREKKTERARLQEAISIFIKPDDAPEESLKWALDLLDKYACLLARVQAIRKTMNFDLGLYVEAEPKKHLRVIK